MSSRYGRWDLLGHARDPVPGDELVVQRLASVYTETGRAIDASARTLRRLADLDGWTGKAAERFGEAADDVAGDLAKAEKRYAMAGEALGTFVRPVGDARDESWAALAAALEAEADLSRTAGDSLAGVAEPTADQLAGQQGRAAAHDAAGGRMQAAKNRLAGALEALSTAAESCASDLREAAAQYKDSRWDNVKGDLRDFADWAHLDVVVKVLTVIAIAIAVVAIAVAMIATAPLWLATALFVAGIAIGALMLAANAALAVSEHPEGSWTNVALDVFGLVTLGASRVLTSGARATVATQRAEMAAVAGGNSRLAEAARLATTAQARSQVPNALRMQPGNPLRVWAEQRQALWAEQATRAGDDAATAVTSPALRDVAAEIRRLQGLPAVSPAVTQALDDALRTTRIGTVVGNAGDVGNVVNAIDLVTPVVDRFDQYIAVVEWRLSR